MTENMKTELKEAWQDVLSFSKNKMFHFNYVSLYNLITIKHLDIQNING